MTAGHLEHTDYVDWDWLPGAAVEVKDYLTRLLSEASIRPHAVESRSKLIASFQEKCARKEYEDPRRQVTDTVAVRLIMYSVTDKERAATLIRERFRLLEDVDPGDHKEPRRRGYDCTHLVVTGERDGESRDWLVAGGDLMRYFERFGGLEIQVRTVAAHAWAEFEHSRRYKGASYEKISEHDQETIDQLFVSAADARRSLDETFIAIDRLLANPTRVDRADEDPDVDDENDTGEGGAEEQGPVGESLGIASPAAERADDGAGPAGGPSRRDEIDLSTLAPFLARRFPDDAPGSDRGIEFGCELVRACGIRTIQDLDRELSAITGTEVRELMDTTTVVTRVRRLDDELLAVLGEDYITWTASIGTVERRGDQLRWRYDRLRDKVTIRRRAVTYQLFGEDSPESVRARKVPAARMVRELAKAVADRLGPELVLRPGAIGGEEDLPVDTRPRPVRLEDGTRLWVATALRRSASEELMAELLASAPEMDLRVIRDGSPLFP